MSKKKKYTCRFFKNKMHVDSYERQLEERDVVILYSMCNRYFLSKGTTKRTYHLMMIYNVHTFVQLRDVNYAILVRLMGKYFDVEVKKLGTWKS